MAHSRKMRIALLTATSIMALAMVFFSAHYHSRPPALLAIIFGAGIGATLVNLWPSLLRPLQPWVLALIFFALVLDLYRALARKEIFWAVGLSALILRMTQLIYTSRVRGGSNRRPPAVS